MHPDLQVVYEILLQWAKGGNGPRPQTYTDLTGAYFTRTGHTVSAHGGWDAPLGAINNRLNAIGAPALSALVVLQATNEPGAGFWGCSPNVPHRPRNDIARLAAWASIVTAIGTYNWPGKLPP